MSDFNFYINRQGLRGRVGEKGDKGDTGFSPYIDIKTNTLTEFVMTIHNENESFDTPNLIPMHLSADIDTLKDDVNRHEVLITNAVEDIAVMETQTIPKVNKDIEDLSAKVVLNESSIQELTTKKQNKLIAGDNIILTDNLDGTVNISSSGGGGSGGDVTAAGNNTFTGNNTFAKPVIYSELDGAIAKTDETLSNTSSTGKELIINPNRISLTSDALDYEYDNGEMAFITGNLGLELTSATDIVLNAGGAVEVDGRIAKVDAKVRDGEGNIFLTSADVDNQTIQVVGGKLHANLDELGGEVNTISSRLSTAEGKVTELENKKQNKLVAGSNVTLENNSDGTVTISSSSGGGSSTPDNVVTIDTEQTITAEKTFTGGAKFGEYIQISSNRSGANQYSSISGSANVNHLNGNWAFNQDPRYSNGASSGETNNSKNTYEPYLRKGNITAGDNITIEETRDSSNNITGVKISAAGGTGGSSGVTADGNNTFTGTNTFNGTTRFAARKGINFYEGNENPLSITVSGSYAQGYDSSLTFGKSLTITSTRGGSELILSPQGSAANDVGGLKYKNAYNASSPKYTILHTGNVKAGDNITLIPDEKTGQLTIAATGGGSGGDITAAGDNTFTGTNTFVGYTSIEGMDGLHVDHSIITQGALFVTNGQGTDKIAEFTGQYGMGDPDKISIKDDGIGKLTLVKNNTDKYLTQSAIKAGNGIEITKSGDGISIASTSTGGATSGEYGIKGDYATQYGIINANDKILDYNTTDKNIKLKQGVLLKTAGGNSGDTIVASDISHTVTTTGKFTLFYANGELLECGKVDWSETEPEDNGVANYQAWFNPNKSTNPDGKWQFKSNDTGNVFRPLDSATPLADITSNETGIVSVDYIGYRIFNDNAINRQWVDKTLKIAENLVFSDSNKETTYNISSYLPDDDLIYEVLVSCFTRTGNTANDSSGIKLTSDIVRDLRVCRCTTRTNSSQSCAGCVVIPIGAARTLTAIELDRVGTSGNSGIVLNGYRRLN